MDSIRIPIELTQGKVAYVDVEDAPLITQYKWHVANRGWNYYAYAYCGREAPLAMHRLLCDAKDGEHIDHIDGNGLNNCRANLRICTHTENIRNQKLSARNKSGYKGVVWDKVRQKWCASIRVDGKTNHLGRFATKEDAARAYNDAATKYFGEFARLNPI